eukprot:COSAG06_NODE_34848_length_468_cov_1.252033_1_plen_55_part_10
MLNGKAWKDSAPTKLPYLSAAHVDAVLSKTGVDKKKFMRARNNLRAAVDGKMHLS